MNRGWRSYVAWGILIAFTVCFVAAVLGFLGFVFRCALTFRDGGWKLFAVAAGIGAASWVVRWAYLRVCADEQIVLRGPS